jgi:patatin-like phospholipase/acyl hydrolase
MPQPKHSYGYNVLSIDGSGGFRSLSQIIHLDEYLKTIPEVHAKDGLSPRPCEHFDLIGGTSVGGLVALMFGPLGMSCDEVKAVYLRMGQRIYIEGRATGAPTIRRDISLREALRVEFRNLLLEKGGYIHSKSGRESKCFVSIRYADFLH